MKFQLSELGNLRKIADADKKAFKLALWKATKIVGEGLRDELRADVKASKMKKAPALAKTVRGQIFPRQAGDGVQRPAYVIGNKAPYIADILQRGGAIRARSGALIVPTANCRKLIKLRPGQPHTDYPREAERRYGKLHVMRAGRGLVALGVNTQTKAGKNKALFLFWLLREVKAPALLHFDEKYRAFQSSFAAKMEAEFMRQYLAAGGTGP